jgi:hypothetical protein
MERRKVARVARLSALFFEKKKKRKKTTEKGLADHPCFACDLAKRSDVPLPTA